MWYNKTQKDPPRHPNNNPVRQCHRNIWNQVISVNESLNKYKYSKNQNYINAFTSLSNNDLEFNYRINVTISVVLW